MIAGDVFNDESSAAKCLGLATLLAIAWAISENRRVVAWRIVLPGIALTLVLALLLLKAPPVQQFFLALNDLLLALERAWRSARSVLRRAVE